MTEKQTGGLSGVWDGAVVEPDRRADARGDPRAGDALGEFARLRAAVTAYQPLPESLARLRPAVVRRPQLWAAVAGAAAMLVLVALTITMLPSSWFARAAADGPPPPARVVRFEPGVDWGPERR